MSGLDCRGMCRIWRWMAYHVTPRWLRYWVVTDVAAQAWALRRPDATGPNTDDDLCRVALRKRHRVRR